MRVHAHEEIMNRIIKQLINKFSYHRGIDYGQHLRTELIEKAKILEQQGKTPEEIVCVLGLPMSYLTTKSSVDMEKRTINQQLVATSRRPTSA